jgi:tetratricopeptide (TPR) repeat protein
LALCAALAFCVWAVEQQQARLREKEIATQQRLQQEDIDKSAMTSAKTLLEEVLKAYNDKSLDLAGARSLAAISGQFLDNVRQSSKTSAADFLWGQSLNDEADLYAILGNNVQSLTVAKQAKDVVQSLMQSNSSAQDGMQLLFDASIRADNALWAMPGRRQEAMQEYDDAVRISTTIASSNGDKGDSDVIDAHLRIGDAYKDGDVKQHQQALAEYQSSLRACEVALGGRPDDFDLLRNKGKAFYRIAELLRGDNALADSRAYYQKAFEVQNGLVSRNARDPSLKSNLAAT